jgi:hypothetical protein
MNPYVLLISGSRALPDPSIVGREISAVVRTLSRLVLIRHGDCPGPDSADQAARRWFDDIGVYLGARHDPMPADWDHCTANCPTAVGHRRRKKHDDIAHPGLLDDYCPGAGPRRNAEMVARGADSMLAFPTGPSYGTRNCMRLAKNAGIHVTEVTR